MPIQPPSRAELARIAEEYRLGLSDEELATFYDRMLPGSLPAARNMTYTRVPALAQRANVRMVSRQASRWTT